MARFDVYSHPDTALRKATPYLLDMQNSYLDDLSTRVVMPLRASALVSLRIRDLNPSFNIAGRDVVLDAAALAAFPAAELRIPVTNLGAQADTLLAALDTLFGGY